MARHGGSASPVAVALSAGAKEDTGRRHRPPHWGVWSPPLLGQSARAHTTRTARGPRRSRNAAFRENTRMPSHRQLIIDHREGRRGFAGSGKALLALFQLQFLPWRRIPIRLPTLPPEPAVRACTTLAKVKASSEAVGTPAARHTGINVD
jgi:hypothetical protein